MEAVQRRERRRLVLGAFGRRRAPAVGGTRDPLTGLMNEPAFHAVAAHALGRSTQAGEPSLLVCCALVPDETESELSRGRRLKQAARGLVEATRAEDVLGRTGPLELSALLPGAAEDDAELVAERLAALQVAVGFAGAPGRPSEVEALLTGARAEAVRTLKLAR